VSLNAKVIDSVARELRAAELGARRVHPLSRKYPEATVEDAYAIQAVATRLRQLDGDPVRGLKIGLTDRQSQQRFGVAEPVFGRLHESAFGTPALIEPLLETEVAFVMGSACQGLNVGVDEVLSATASMRPAFEIIDSRARTRPGTVVDLISDNTAAARVVLSAETGARVDPSRLTVRLWGEDELLETGSSARVLGHPAEAVAWLVRALARCGKGLGANDVVLSGTCTAPVPFDKSTRYRADFGALGSVSVEPRPNPPLTARL